MTLHWRGSHPAQDEAAIQQPCEECNAEAGEPCRPYCIGKAAHDEAGE